MKSPSTVQISGYSIQRTRQINVHFFIKTFKNFLDFDVNQKSENRYVPSRLWSPAFAGVPQLSGGSEQGP